jgi:uncharacterized protein (DUF1778 family)
MASTGRFADFRAKAVIALRRAMSHKVAMNTSFLKTRVPAETKALVQAAAAQAYLSEAAWCRRSIDLALRTAGAIDPSAGRAVFTDHRCKQSNGKQNARIYVRLRRDDRIILKERARARGMPVATYASVLLRSHLRQLPPLPRAELEALKECVTQLGAIGRNLNQIARAVNTGRTTQNPARADLEALLRVCDALRVHVKDLLKANLESWAVGYADDQD